MATMSPATFPDQLYTDIPAERKKMHLIARGVHLRITHKSKTIPDGKANLIMVKTSVHKEWRIMHTPNWLLRLELMLCNPAVRCNVHEKWHVQGKQGS